MVKVAKYANLIIGLYLVVTAVLNTIAVVTAFYIFEFTLTLYTGLFGFLMVASSMFPKMKCIKNNFLFLLTGLGKGLFNIFVGCILFYTTASNGTAKRSITTDIAGYVCIGSGLMLLFLSRFKMISEANIDDKKLEIKMVQDLQDKAKNKVINTAGDVAK